MNREDNYPLPDSSIDGHGRVCFNRNRNISLSVLAICVWLAITTILIPDPYLKHGSVEPFLKHGPVDTVTTATAIFFSFYSMSIFRCFRERLVFAILGISLAVSLLSDLGHGDLLPASVVGIQFALRISA